MLKKEAEERPTITEILKFDWVQPHLKKAESKRKLDAILDNHAQPKIDHKDRIALLNNGRIANSEKD